MPRFFSGREHRLMRTAKCNGRRTFNGVRRLGRVSQIYDGDTIHISTSLNPREDTFEYSVRLAGIDAPEMKPPLDMPNRDVHKQAAEAVRARVAEIIPVGTVVCVDYSKEEKFGRLMGRVHTLEPGCCGLRWRPKDDVASILLQEGLVVEYSGGAKEGFSDEQLRRIAGLVPRASLYPTIHDNLVDPGSN